MFKKYYKQANDDIQPNRELIDKIFEQAEKNKKPISAVVYKYGMAVAAVLVLAVSAFSYPKIAEYADVNDREIVQSDISEKHMTAEKKNGTEVTYSVNEEVVDNVQLQADEKQQNTKVNTVMEKSTAAVSAESIVEDYATQNDAPSEESILNENIPAVASEESAETGVVTSSSKIRAYFGDEGTETVVWSIEKYKEYLGMDIDNMLNIPSDLNNTTGNVFHIVLKDGEVENDLATFSFSSEERMVLVETSKKIKALYSQEADVTTEEINSCMVHHCKLNTDEYETYLENKGINFRIYSRGISETELRILIESVTKL